MGDDVAFTQPERRRATRWLRMRTGLPLVGLLGVATFDAHGQVDPGTATNRPFAIDPSISVNETLSDNAGLSSTDRRTDLISEISPTLRMSSAAGHVQGHVNYALSGIDYARNTLANSLEQSLDANVKVQAIDEHLFIDGTATISRQNISALGTQTPDQSLKTDNQTQVESASVAPYFRARLGSFASWQLSANYAKTHTDSNAIGDSDNAGQSFHLGSDQQTARLNWSLDLSRQLTDFSVGRATTTRSAVGSLDLNPTPELQFSLRGGREGNDVESAEIKGSPTYGGGLRWTPSERTTLSLQDDRHYFGNGYALNFEHRSGQTVWTVSGTRNATTDASAASQTQLVSAFDLLYLQLTSKFPDPVARANQTLLELQQLGIDPLAVAPIGFLTNAVTVQRNLTFSFAYIGQRTNIVFSALQGDTSRLDALSSADDSLAGGNQFRQRAFSVAISRRLSPQSSADLTLADNQSIDKITGNRVDLRTVSINWSTRLGTHTQMSLGARHSVSTGESSYDESAVLASLNLQL